MSTPETTRSETLHRAAPPLDPAARRRGRRLAIASHPAGMTHRMVFTDQLPTLALVALGASETLVGIQRSFGPAGALLQLPTLRAIARFPKRTLLLAGHCVALAGGIPLLFFGGLERLPAELGTAIVLASLAVVALGFAMGETVWFPILRGYVEPDRVGRFFGTLRTGWHIALIVYFIGAQRWLSSHPGSFAPLFAVGFGLGLLRIALIARLPERSERTGQRIRVREAIALLRHESRLRRYLLSVSLSGAVARTALPFAIVMMRRALDLSASQVLLTTIATFCGGLLALYPSGRIVDRVGPAPLLRWTSIGMALLLFGLLAVREPGTGALPPMVAFFFAYSALFAGFGVADTDVLFNLAPGHAPARLIVISAVTVNVVTAATPIIAGLALEWALARWHEPLAVYHGFFVVAALVQGFAFLPLRRFRRESLERDEPESADRDGANPVR
ncbi:MAG: MFS transporter [Deltaproteobacteria bacterium]|nr:MAG: MFS transporter [Deltaproteobacteria bacterium]